MFSFKVTYEIREVNKIVDYGVCLVFGCDFFFTCHK